MTPREKQPVSPGYTDAFGPITRTDIVRYAGAGGDFNPMHHDEPAAQAAGYPSVFAQGLLTAGLLASAVEAWLGALALRRYSVRYVGQVWPGDVIEVEGKVVATQPDGEGQLVTCELVVRGRGAAGDRVVLTGSAVALVGSVGEVAAQ